MIREQGDSETAVLSRYPSSVTLRKLLPFPNSRTFVCEAIARFFYNNKYNKQVFVIGLLALVKNLYPIAKGKVLLTFPFCARYLIIANPDGKPL